MSIPKKPLKAKLVVSFVSKSSKLINSSIEQVAIKYGAPDYVSAIGGFTHTKYYDEELGDGLKRRFAAFTKMVKRDDLPKIKKFTNLIELDSSVKGKRKVNIDPGILTVENFILASGKNFTHRVYLKDGIFADLTLIFTKNDFLELPWTYPDYRERDVKDMLKKIRATAFLM